MQSMSGNNTKNEFAKALTNKNPCKPMKEKNALHNRFITRLSAVYPPFIMGTRSVLRSGCPIVDRRLFVSANPSQSKNVWEFTYRELRDAECQADNRNQVCLLKTNNTNLSNPKPRHTTGRSGRSARRSSRAGSGKIGCQQNFSPRKHKPTVPSKASKKRRFNVSPEARTSEILCKPMEEQNQRLTRGLSPVYHGFISGTRSALCSWLPTSGPTPLCLCKPFSCKACPEKK